MTRQLPEISDNMPQMGNRFTRWLGRTALRWLGWRVEGKIPNYKRLLVAAAPHTSNWDFIIAMSIFMALGLRMSYLMKKEAFVWPFKNLFIKLGGIPINRDDAGDTVEQVTSWYGQHECVWVALTPEGTRKKVEKWKTGFVRIAYQANIPILLVIWDYPHKVLRLDSVWFASGDYDQDVAEMKAYVNEHFCGKNPEFQ